MRRSTGLLLCLGVVGAAGAWLHAADQLPPYESGIIWPEPTMVEPGSATKAPSDAIVLFDGKDLSKWKDGEKWRVEDGIAYADKGYIRTKQPFGDCQLHLEFATPEEAKGKEQQRGNSGVFLMGKYEVQILDSYDNPTYFDGQAGAIYKQRPPMVNASRKPGEWQEYDIIFTAPRFAKDGKLSKPAYVTVLHNGVVIQNHTELEGETDYRVPPHYKKHADKLPISLQYHGQPVKFRNIWIREINEPVGKKAEKKTASTTSS
ncbi:hypothetical protein Pan216_54620 [Planctomycetes bacterium Pan216]|uniref:3-keto-alpha-glucoside-1,2-lyase/3-keto-2-hydroxy-glucal hydratase domain-containing protein n=1 Tax=Kolteria novifilia TaxID=2527975 RepID=A0A518BC62_9BACT|nr:hypothetical protein Pan216_54620 [Planctomycetes bacterium Pan216]